MRIRRISIEAIRSHLHRLDLELSLDSINILHGPNGSGKSSVLAALNHAFLTPHDSASATLAALVPWGTSLSPSVEVHFTHRDGEFRLRKQFLHSPLSLLESHSAGAWKPLAKGKQADARLREFLGAAPDGKATQDRLLASVLWTQQGELALSAVSPNVHSALTQQLDSPAAQRLLKWIDTQAAGYWTPTSRVQKHSPAARLEAERAALEARQSALRAELGSIAALRDEIVALEITHDESQSAAVRARAGLDQLSQSVSESASLRQRRDSLAPLIAAQSKQVELVSAAVQSVERAQSDLATLRPEFETLSSQAGRDLDPRLDGITAELASANAELLAAHAFLALQSERTSLEARLAANRETQAAIAGLEGELRGLNAPSAAQLVRVKGLAARLAQLTTSLDSASLRLEIEAQRPIPIEILEGDQPGVQTLDPAAAQFFTASPRLRFSIAGIGEFTVTGPASSAAELKSGIAAAAAERDSLAATLGTADIAE
ncbi:MAG TPA: AAA family ATPase, partial [Bryobacteraceae bacterium]|nr:AAA family ATPase [Bryobacteraceae bacterium]